MGPGTGILALVDYLDLPEIYTSYGDTNVDRLTNPDLYADSLRVGGNAFLDAMTFLGDIGADIPAVAADYISEGVDLYNPFTEEGMKRNTLIPGLDFQPQNLTGLSDKGRDFAASTISGLTGFPSFTTDNPLMNPQMLEELEIDTGKTIRSKYDSQFKKAEDIANQYTNENAATMDRYFTVNPGNTYEEYDAYLNNMFNDKYNSEVDKFAEDFNQDFMDLRTKNSVNMFGYDAFEAINEMRDTDSMMGNLASYFGPGVRKLTLGNISGTDIPMKYASQGEFFIDDMTGLPIQKFAGPEQQRLQDLTGIVELIGGLGYPIVRKLAKTAGKNANQADRLSPELEEAINEYYRD